MHRQRSCEDPHVHICRLDQHTKLEVFSFLWRSRELLIYCVQVMFSNYLSSSFSSYLILFDEIDSHISTDANQSNNPKALMGWAALQYTIGILSASKNQKSSNIL